jgi:fatty acid desaturase
MRPARSRTALLAGSHAERDDSAALELTPAALRRRFAHAFEVRRPLYWFDLLASAAIGWAAFAASGWLGRPHLALAALAVATLALYRAVLFIHELAHLRTGAVPGFPLAWNLVAGLPLLTPSILYVGTHTDHHRRSTYGTARDPEYESIAHWSPLRIVASTLLMPLLPALIALRWAVLAPLGWLLPPLRRRLIRHLSALVINASYDRPLPRGRRARRFWIEEAAATASCWLAIALVAGGVVEPHWLGRWYAVATGILVLNHLRTLAAHRYEHTGEPMDVTAQLLDTVNVEGIPVVTALLAPVGLRYHGLHHLLPSLPYHSLGAVHRALRTELPADSPYRRTEAGGLVAALGELLETARANQRRRA